MVEHRFKGADVRFKGAETTIGKPKPRKGGLFAAVRRILGFGKKAEPEVERRGGSRGAGWKVPEGAGRVAERLSPDEVDEFIYNARMMPVNSSNVSRMQYDINRQKLIVTFLPKGRRPESQYEYSNVDEERARAIAEQYSKGGAVWDHLRIRGTRLGHQVPYRRIR